MVCENEPYLRALEGLRHTLRECCPGIVPKEIDIVGLEPVYDEDSFEQKIQRMGSGRRFLRHVNKLARIAGCKVTIFGWNQFLLKGGCYMGENKIVVGQLGSRDEYRPVVVAVTGPAEERFIGMMQSNKEDFVDFADWLLDPVLASVGNYAEMHRRDRQLLQNLMTY